MKQIHILVSLALSAILLSSCEEEVPSLEPTIPSLEPVEVENKEGLVFVLKGITPTPLVHDCGFYISDNASMKDAAKYHSKLKGDTFTIEMTLRYNRNYYVCSYISNGRTEIFSDIKTISIALQNFVTFGSVNVESYNRESGVTSFSTSCSVAEGVNVTNYGILWGTSANLKTSGTAKELTFPTDGKPVKFELPDLELGKQYYICQYFTDTDVTVYGNAEQFNVCTRPFVTTAAISGVSDCAATCGGTVTNDGGAFVTQRGVIWGTSAYLTVSMPTKTVNSSGIGSFSSSITDLIPNTSYYVCSYATNSIGTAYGELKFFRTEVDYSSATDLSSPESANCYIVSSGGKYKFKTVNGNSSTSVGNVASCEVLWESLGTSTIPSQGNLIPYAMYQDGYIYFTSSSSKGNAVIAAKDASGNILWSWHIWLTDTPLGQTYNNNAGVIMDRNLGATSATPGDVGALGLLYQWGRKDPFLSSSSISSSTEAKSTITWPSPVGSSASIGTISYTIAHPTTFISYNSNNYDWYYTGDSSTDNTRWQSSKTIYDPCPVGWRVPNGGSNGVWATAFGTSSYWTTSSNWNSTYKGMDFSKTDNNLGSSGPIWYPASGYRGSSSGSLYGVGSCGYFWSVSPNGTYAYDLHFDRSDSVVPADDDRRAFGQSVRCLQE
ncbi:MAG: hypothetical protein ACI3ZP_09995 [Candidatus Cryptobacteroides sp.]